MAAYELIEAALAAGAAGGAADIIPPMGPDPGRKPKDPCEGVAPVLGHYPDYEEVAKELGAPHFSMPSDVFDALSPTEQWAANQAFLDGHIAEGNLFILATPLEDMLEGPSYYRREIEHLKNNGYSPGCGGTRMVP